MNQEKDKQRTLKQNAALHKYFELLAEELNSAGLDMRHLLKESIDIPWSASSVKDFLWRPIQNAQLGKSSTTELTRKEIDIIYDTLTRHLGERFGVFVEFPSEEMLEGVGGNEVVGET